MLLFIFYYVILFVVCIYAARRGHWPERWGVLVLAVGSIATTLVAMGMRVSWIGAESAVLSVDIAMLFSLIYLVLVSDRFWPIWATAFQLVSISIHIAVMVAPQIAPWAYATGQGLWAYLVLIALAVGAHEYVMPTKLENTDNS